MTKCPDCGTDAPTPHKGHWICLCIRKRNLLDEMARLRLITESGCWEWQGTLDSAGYGRKKFRMNGAIHHGIYRVSYAVFNGDITKGMEVDHKCRNRKCFNPDHLRLTTKRENILCGENNAAVNARKTHCIRGHSLTGDDVFVDKKNGRHCNACRRFRKKVGRQLPSNTPTGTLQ